MNLSNFFELIYSVVFYISDLHIQLPLCKKCFLFVIRSKE